MEIRLESPWIDFYQVWCGGPLTNKINFCEIFVDCFKVLILYIMAS